MRTSNNSEYKIKKGNKTLTNCRDNVRICFRVSSEFRANCKAIDLYLAFRYLTLNTLYHNSGLMRDTLANRTLFDESVRA